MLTLMLTVTIAVSPAGQISGLDNPERPMEGDPDFDTQLLEHDRAQRLSFTQRLSKTQPGSVQLVRLSSYYPGWGGTNCGNFVDGQCLSRTASGLRWQDWVERGCACSTRYAFGTRFVIQGESWTCIDRGGKVHSNWVDLLTPNPRGAYGSTVQAVVIEPDQAEGLPAPPPPAQPNWASQRDEGAYGPAPVGRPAAELRSAPLISPALYPERLSPGAIR